MGYIKLFGLCAAFFFAGLCVSGIDANDARKIKEIEDEQLKRLPRCRCTDPHLCDTWCRAKDLFKRNPPFGDYP